MAINRRSSGGWTAIGTVRRRSGGGWVTAQSVKRRSGGSWVTVWTNAIDGYANDATSSGSTKGQYTMSSTAHPSGGTGNYSYRVYYVGGYSFNFSVSGNVCTFVYANPTAGNTTTVSGTYAWEITDGNTTKTIYFTARWN